MRVQCLWQNRADITETRLIAEANFLDPDAALKWCEETFEKHKADLPDGWCPMVMVPDPETS